MTRSNPRDGAPSSDGTSPHALLDFVRAIRWCVVLAARAVWELVLFCAALVSATLVLVGIGVPATTHVLARLRIDTDTQRRQVVEYSALRLKHREVPGSDLVDRVAQARGLGEHASVLADVARRRRTWMDLAWSIANPVVGFTIALVPLFLLLDGIFGLTLPLTWSRLDEAWGGTWYLFVPLTSEATAWVGALLGAAQLVLAWVLARPFLTLHGRWTKLMLDRVYKAEVEQRLEVVSRSRAETVDFQAKELRRIERDLHDGAQARLVAMGMNLNAAARLVSSDPEKAREMIVAARDSSTSALQELRDLVRGVHPPVLADRGLVEAIRSAALEAPLPVKVTSSLSGRLALPLESAMFFAVSECLTNVVRHAEAAHALVDVRLHDGNLVIEVSDDGRGGADPTAGSGLDGIRRRLEAFDGSVGIRAQHPWATVVTLSAPYEASAPPSPDVRRDAPSSTAEPLRRARHSDDPLTRN